jgi:hypothetical protein
MGHTLHMLEGIILTLKDEVIGSTTVAPPNVSVPAPVEAGMAALEHTITTAAPKFEIEVPDESAVSGINEESSHGPQ